MRSQLHEVAVKVQENDLGTIVCQHCNTIIDTLPTNGVKIKYMSCDQETCRNQERSALA